MASIYRFQSAAAIHTTGGPTRYIGPKQARDMARALLRVARSIESESFTDSNCGTTEIPDYEHAPDIRKHAPATHVVKVDMYSLEPGQMGKINRTGTVYESRHKSARAAARRLAEMINRKTARAHEVTRALDRCGGLYTIDGLSLVDFRKVHGL